MFRLRSGIFGKLVLQRLAFTSDAEETFIDAKAEDVDVSDLDSFYIVPMQEFLDMKERVVQADRRAKAQRDSRKARALPPVAMETNPLEQA